MSATASAPRNSPSARGQSWCNRIGELPVTNHPHSYDATVTSSKRQLSSRLIFLGFALVALSTVIFIARLLSEKVYYLVGFHWYIQVVMEMLAPSFAASAWWFLRQLEATDSKQRSLLAKAYLLLGLQFSASCVVQLLQFTSTLYVDPYIAQFWLVTFGSGIGAVGFFLASHVVSRMDVATSDT